MALQQWRKY